MPVSMAGGAHALTVPWYPGPLGARLNPAFMVGTDRTWRERDRWRLFYAVNLGFFRHHWWMTGISIEPEVGVGRSFLNGVRADLRMGLGYMHYFWRRETLELNEGRYSVAKDWGKPSIVLPLSTTIGYHGPSGHPFAVAPFLSARWIVQGMFLEEAPVMTHFLLLGGVRIDPKSRSAPQKEG